MTNNLAVFLTNTDCTVVAHILRLGAHGITFRSHTDWGDRTTVKPENLYTPDVNSFHTPASLFSRVAIADDKKCPICGIRHDAAQPPPSLKQSFGSPSNS
jgi:hypothetical protein